MSISNHKKFLVIKPTSIKKENMFRSWKHKYFKQHYYNRLLRRLELADEEILIAGNQGVCVWLPFTVEEIKEIGQDYMSQLIQKILDRYGVSSCYFGEQLKFLQASFCTEKGWIFKYLLLGECMEQIMYDKKIEKKDAHWVVVDGGDRLVELVLQYVIPKANYLTIISERPVYFDKMKQIVYNETGLIVSVLKPEDMKRIDGNIILNLEQRNYQLYKRFDRNAIIYDLDFSEQKLEYILNRRRDLVVIYDIDILINGYGVEKNLAAEILVRDNWKLRRMSENPGSLMPWDELVEIGQNYQVSIKGVKKIQPYKSIID